MGRRLIFLLVSILFISLFVAPNIYLARAASVILLDDFNDGDANDGSPVDWNEHAGTMSSWYVQNGKYVGTVYHNGSSQGWSTAGEDSWSNYKFEVEMKGISGVDQRILFRVNNDVTQGYGLKYLENSLGFSGHLALVKMKPGLPNQALAWDYDFKSQIGEKHNLEVVVDGTHIKAYVDGLLRIDYFDIVDPNLNGKVGLFEERAGFPPNENFNGYTTTEYDNVKVSLLEDQPVGPFDLPFSYDGRGEGDAEKLKTAFNDRFTSLFDHSIDKDTFTNFLGDNYIPEECDTNKFACYNSHNGVDFDDAAESNQAISVSDGEVVYRSDDSPGQGNEKCIPENSGYGCVVIAEYPTNQGNIYGLYAHLNEIYVNEDEKINSDTVLGKMGHTGRGTGVHLHFGALEELTQFGARSLSKTNKEVWKSLLQISSSNQIFTTDHSKSACTYSIGGKVFAFMDPTGWSGDEIDPYNKTKIEGGCEMESPYLWKYMVN